MTNPFTRWFGAQRRERTLRKYAIDESLWRRTLDAYPCFGHLNPADLERLRETASLFIAQRNFRPRTISN